MECWESTVLNWCEEMVINMKGQLTRCENGRLKNFIFSTILIAFALERIPLLRPHQILTDEGDPRDPHMLRWVALMESHGGDGPVVRYTLEFFDWLGQRIISIEDFPYVRMDYRGASDIPLLVGAQ